MNWKAVIEKFDEEAEYALKSAGGTANKPVPGELAGLLAIIFSRFARALEKGLDGQEE